MKKRLSTLLSVLMTAGIILFTVTSCSVKEVSSSDQISSHVTETAQADVQIMKQNLAETEYQVSDLVALQSFLLCRPVEIGSDKDFDLNDDGKWNVFDLCLMRRALLQQRVEKQVVFAPTVTLNSGYEMPILGLGTWTLNGEEVENAVYWAICDGYRLIDTAYWYGNETEVGKAVRRAIDEGIITREDIFITSKVPPYGFDDYEQAIEDCNNRLNLGYIDLMLIHQSGTDEKKLYRAIEAEVKKGTVRSLGISNYYTPEEFDDITDGAEIMPAVVQNENHIYHQNTELQAYVKQYGTFVESWYPFGGRGHTSENLNNETIQEIAKAHGKTGAQIILRWQTQAGYIVIPGSSNKDHIMENISIFDFELTDDEMQRIAELHTGHRYESW